MDRCIKCGREIPDGELFCLECSMNLSDSPLRSSPASVGPLSGGRMQAPRSAPKEQVVTAEKKTKESRSAAAKALVVVSLLLAGTLAFLFWQYGSLQVERTRVERKQADMILREQEAEELEAEIQRLLEQQAQLEETLEEKDRELQSLNNQLTGSQSGLSQSAYDLSTAQAELQRLEEENRELLLLEQDLESEIKRLNTALIAAQNYQVKAEFMDRYVVFGNNNNTGLYHTYDCEKFVKSNFWAYSRTLAERTGFKPCPDCMGKAR